MAFILVEFAVKQQAGDNELGMVGESLNRFSSLAVVDLCELISVMSSSERRELKRKYFL